MQLNVASKHWMVWWFVIGVDTVPVMTSMQSSPDTAQLLSTLYTEAKKLNIRKHTRYLETGLEEDEYQEILQDIADLQKCYLPKCDMGWNKHRIT